MKDGCLKTFISNSFEEESEQIEALAINPTPEIVSLVQRLLKLI